MISNVHFKFYSCAQLREHEKYEIILRIHLSKCLLGKSPPQ